MDVGFRMPFGEWMEVKAFDRYIRELTRKIRVLHSKDCPVSIRVFYVQGSRDKVKLYYTKACTCSYTTAVNFQVEGQDYVVYERHIVGNEPKVVWSHGSKVSDVDVRFLIESGNIVNPNETVKEFVADPVIDGKDTDFIIKIDKEIEENEYILSSGFHTISRK